MGANRTIGHAYRLESVLCCGVSGIGIRVVLASQLLVPRLESLDRYGPVQRQCTEMVAQGRGSGLAGGIVPLAGGLSTPRARGGKNIQRVENLFLIEILSTTCAQFPRGALPRDVGSKLRLDLARCHTLIEVPARIVLTDVLQAEPEILSELRTVLGRTISRMLGAAGHVAVTLGRVGIRVEGPVSCGFALHDRVYVRCKAH